MRAVSLLLPSVALAILAFSGCDRSEQSVGKTVPVKGRITYKGKPLIQGSVTFEPEDAGRAAEGKISPDGIFVLSTFKEGDGAVPGVHRVKVGNGAIVTSPKDALPAKRKNTQDSIVSVEVVEGKTEYDIDLK